MPHTDVVELMPINCPTDAVKGAKEPGSHHYNIHFKVRFLSRHRVLCKMAEVTLAKE